IILGAADVDNDTLAYTVLSGPAHGTLTGSGPARTYAPEADFSGTDGFVFQAADDSRSSGPFTVSLTVTGVNDPPMVIDDRAPTTQDVPLSLTAGDLTSNDTAGPDNESSQTLTITAVSPVSTKGGTVFLKPDGNVTYTPGRYFSGTDTFTYTVT